LSSAIAIRISYAELADLDLSRFCFAGSNLDGATLTGCDLTRATLTGAELTGADLTGAIGIDTPPPPAGSAAQS
jgi:uncharacterized protein YjbI with pentapeptide repeats